MDNEVLDELRKFSSLLSKLMGTSDEVPADLFKKEEITKAAKLFRKMEIQRGEWVCESDLGKYFKEAPYQTGKFIREEFQFTAWIRNGHQYLYNKKALQLLTKECKDRNLNLGRYIQYKKSQAEFEKKVTASKVKGRPLYTLPDEARDINTSSIPVPEIELVQNDLNFLKAEFHLYKMNEYIDIYKDNHAMMKFIYYFEKYIEPALKKRCIKWCDSFNYANRAYELITRKKPDKFDPVKEEDKIEL